MNKLKVVLSILFVSSVVWWSTEKLWPQNPVDATVMVVSNVAPVGGTGSIIETSSSRSLILTNAHVCKGAVAGGGTVITNDRKTHQAQAVFVSTEYDLCLISVDEDLKHKLSIAKKSPDNFQAASIIGHPQLLPTIISKGEFGGKLPITLMVDSRKCEEKDFSDANTHNYCIFFGFVPILKTFESRVVSALIMPGNSDSAILNSDNELSGVVFAGSGSSLSYAFAMPLEAVINFLNESKYSKFQTVEEFTAKTTATLTTKELKSLVFKSNFCATEDPLNICKVLRFDMPLETNR